MDQVKYVAYLYFFPKFPTELTCVVNQTVFRKYIFTLCLITVKKLLKGYSSSDLSTVCFYL